MFPGTISAYAKEPDLLARARPNPFGGLNGRIGKRIYFFPVPKYCLKMIYIGLSNTSFLGEKPPENSSIFGDLGSRPHHVQEAIFSSYDQFTI